MPKQLTVRGVPGEVAKRLEAMSREQGKSVNAVVLEILEGVVDFDRRRKRLERYATWTSEDLREFEGSLAAQRVIDDDLWS